MFIFEPIILARGWSVLMGLGHMTHLCDSQVRVGLEVLRQLNDRKVQKKLVSGESKF